jgi:hypothetical protein
LVFYNCEGRAVAYSDDDCHIYLFNGIPIAYIAEDSVYSFGGAHLGWFKDGWIFDHSGAYFLFTEGAQGGPLKPLMEIAPNKGLKGLLPLKGLKEMKPLPPTISLEWSSFLFHEFFRF